MEPGVPAPRGVVPNELADGEVDATLVRPSSPSAPAPAYTGGAFRMGGHEAEPASRNLDYLLEDEEETGSGGRGWLLGIVVALALAGGLGYWHYRNGGWSSAKPAEATADATGTTGSTSGDNPASTQSAPGSVPNPNTTSSTPSAAIASSPAPAAAALTEVRPQNPTEAPADKPEKAAKPDVVVTAPPAVKAAGKDPEAAVPTKPARAARPEAPVKAEDPVTLGEKYIYGRGLPQNCDRGLRLVKPAADGLNSKAMITMGALYATGHCVTRDLPTAYRFFALALRKDPENAALKQNAEMVWGQMTQSERQQAIRLTQ